MTYRPLTRAAAVAVTLALPLSAACSDDDDDRGVLETPGAGQDADQTTPTASDDGATTETTETTEPTDAGSGTDQGDVPQDAALNVEQRHPTGTTLRLSHLSFDGNDIFIDFEVINSGSEEITFHDGSDGSYSLRLVDDAGQEYIFVEPPHETTPFLDDGAIYADPGETVSGTIAFRGPLLGRPSQIQLVTNVVAEDIAGFELDEQYEGAHSPGFVVPIDLTWA